MLDDQWLLDNISIQVEDGGYSLFWKDLWLDGVSLDLRYARLFDLVVNKFFTDADRGEQSMMTRPQPVKSKSTVGLTGRVKTDIGFKNKEKRV